MQTEFYRTHRIEITERPNFWEADVFYGRKTTNLYAYVYQQKSGNRTIDDLRGECFAVIDEKVTWENEVAALKASRYEIL